jgi:RNA polymerase sigma-70 factor (ECF subfamily)
MHTAAANGQEDIILNPQLNSESSSLVAEAKAGNTEAFDVLASTYRKRLLNTVRRITGNIAEAEDLTQEALIKAFVGIHSFRGACSFSTWLTRIAINEALMWKRKPRQRAETSWPNASSSCDPGIAFDVADNRPNPEQRYDDQERRRIAYAAISKMRPAPRLALEMCALNEHSLKDLARAEDISLSAAKSRLFRSRNIIRAKVTRLLGARDSQQLRPTVQPA